MTDLCSLSSAYITVMAIMEAHSHTVILFLYFICLAEVKPT